MFKQISDTSYYRGEVSEFNPLFVMLNYYWLLLVFLFLGCQFFREIIYDTYGMSIIQVLFSILLF